jgi:hypothetical protein
VKFLEDVGYMGSRHFDAHAYRTSDYEDVKAFARGCMRTYLILKEKAERWNADRHPGTGRRPPPPTTARWRRTSVGTAEAAAALGSDHDRSALALVASRTRKPIG